MPRTVRAVSAPAGGTKVIGEGRSYRMQSGSIGASNAANLGGSPVDAKFESGQSDDAWLAEVRRKERAEGLTAPAPHTEWLATGRDKQTYVPEPRVVWAGEPELVRNPTPQNLDGLPEKFTLSVELKSGWWKVTAPECHVGLFVAHQDLVTALTDAPGALAQILRLDGAVPVARRGRKKQ